MKSITILLGLILLIATTTSANHNPTNNNAEAKSASINTSLEGVVIDKLTGEPLVGVEVGIEGTGLKAYTDFDGSFRFESLIPGDYFISASLISYQFNRSNKFTVSENKVNALNLKLVTVNR